MRGYVRMLTRATLERRQNLPPFPIFLPIAFKHVESGNTITLKPDISAPKRDTTSSNPTVLKIDCPIGQNST